MKKVLCVLAAIAMVAAITTSCEKKCTCKTYLGGKEIASMTINMDEINKEAGTNIKCADMNEGTSSDGIVCK